jgi:predicted nucleotidyltransferase
MTYTKVTYKDRERDRRGQVKSFNDLPIDAQQKFVEIKNYINNYLNRQINVYLYGSYYWGYWDEFSNFDVIVREDINTSEVSQLIMSELGIDNNVIFNNEVNRATIQIP